jgi:predicted ATP-grasp superfamily ATP-dependent carboligase
MRARPEVLLTVADHIGTLAATRSLGRAGVRVVMADPHLLAPARWSRYVTRTLSCPDASEDPKGFIEWLLALGAREPGKVLYPTSDDVALLYTMNADALGRHYKLYLPTLRSMLGLLDKWRLYQACLALEIDTPRTWLATSAADLARVRAEARFPVVIKPCTQAFLSPHQKGRIAHDAASLGDRYAALEHATRYAPMLLELAPEEKAPIVQAFSDTIAEGIVNVSGFVDETGELFVAEASRKVLQWPRRLGIGMCFEAVEPHPRLADSVARICSHFGYHGAFEVEFLPSPDGRDLLIDFNPRFYGQMGFDVARGLDLPWLVYLAALGERAELARAVKTTRERTKGAVGTRHYTNRIELEIVMRLRRIAGAMTRDELLGWRRWLAAGRGQTTDAVLDRGDWMPGILEATTAVFRRAVHPRSTWRGAKER